MFFSINRWYKKACRKLDAALEKADNDKVVFQFSRGLKKLTKNNAIKLLKVFIHSYADKIENPVIYKDRISSSLLLSAAAMLNRVEDYETEIKIYNLFDFMHEAIDLLSRQRRAEELVMKISTINPLESSILLPIINLWEKYNGPINMNPVISATLQSIVKYAPHAIPEHAGAKETAGLYEEAARLYERDQLFKDAVRCYDSIKNYAECIRLYKILGDDEGISLSLEYMGDLENALNYVIKPQRKIMLLIRTGRLQEAKSFAAGMEDKEKYLVMIKEEAEKRIPLKIESHEYLEAFALADLADAGKNTREEILKAGCLYFEKCVTAAASEEELDEVYRNRIKLEEAAGHFEKAAKIAEAILKDFKLAALLYKKANKYNLAINLIETSKEEDKTKLGELAALHEEAGSLLKAAACYEKVGEFKKASVNYERAVQYEKAIECHKKTGESSQAELIRLYTKASLFEKIVDIYLEDRSVSNLEKALSIAETYHLQTYINLLEDELEKKSCSSLKDMEACYLEAKGEIIAGYVQVLGIDFGTTNSVVAVFNRQSRQVEIIPGAHEADFEPTYFGLDDQKRPVFGEAARKRYLIDPGSVIPRVKRSLGQSSFFTIGGKTFRNEEIIAQFLSYLQRNVVVYLKKAIEKIFHDKLKSRNLKFLQKHIDEFLEKQDIAPINDVVLTVPAYFNNIQKQATRDSAELAGLKVKRLLHEPTAAALAYGYKKSYTGDIAVIDLGGGTLDISILNARDGVYEVLCVGGDTKLGGCDIDAALLNLVVRDIHTTLGINITFQSHPQEVARLTDACENLKIQLSLVSEFTMELNYFLNNPKYVFTLSRERLENLCNDFLQKIENQVVTTIKESKLSIGRFLLVGNATKMPAIPSLISKVINGEQLKGINPGTVVAVGAALQGAILAGEVRNTLLVDIVPYSLGIAALKKESSKEEIQVFRIIEKNSIIPCRNLDTFTTTRDNQEAVDIKIYQGESPHPHLNFFLGNFRLSGIRPGPAQSKKIEVTFEIDADCILDIRAVDVETGKSQAISIKDIFTLSPSEKHQLEKKYKDGEQTFFLERDLKQVREVIAALQQTFTANRSSADQIITDFFRLISDISAHPQNYSPTEEQTDVIRCMFMEKDVFLHGIPHKYTDQFSSLVTNIKKADEIHLDYSSTGIIGELRERVSTLKHYRNGLNQLINDLDSGVIKVLNKWIQVLKSVKPNLEKMSPMERVNYYLSLKRVIEAQKLLESLLTGEEGVNKEGLTLLLSCYVQSGSREEYRSLIKRYAHILEMPLPDFAELNLFLKNVNRSLFLIRGIDDEGTSISGSGFAVSPNLILTNRHVLQGLKENSIELIGHNTIFKADAVTLDGLNDIAVIRISGTVPPLIRGEFNFLEPGERVLAIGFPAPGKGEHKENLYISDGIVNSIRKIEATPERIIFMDTKIGGGMSGGPLLNDLGEVIGIITCYYVKDIAQPVALPINLVNKYLLDE